MNETSGKYAAALRMATALAAQDQPVLIIYEPNKTLTLIKKDDAPMQDQAAGEPFSQESPAPGPKPCEKCGYSAVHSPECPLRNPLAPEAPKCRAYAKYAYRCGGVLKTTSFVIPDEVACHSAERLRRQGWKEEKV